MTTLDQESTFCDDWSDVRNASIIAEPDLMKSIGFRQFFN